MQKKWQLLKRSNEEKKRMGGTRQSCQLTVVVSDIAGDRRRQLAAVPANYKRYQTSR